MSRRSLLRASSLAASPDDSRYLPFANGLSQQPSPLVIAHRFGANVVPEATLEGARVMTALGANVLECDTHVLTDSSTVVMHDATIDRTTTGTGNTTDLSAPRVAQLVADAGSWHGGGWGNCTVPSFDAILREFGNRSLLVPEAKSTGSGAALASLLQRYKISTDHAMVQSFLTAELVAPKAAGYPVMRLASASGDITAAQAASNGWKWVGLSATGWSPSEVAAFHAVGVKVAVYTINRQNELTAWTAVGIDGVFSDDPLYLSDRQELRTTDPYASKSYWHGHMASDGQTDRGYWANTKDWGSNVDESSARSILQGWATPKLKERNTAGGTFQIDLSWAPDVQNVTLGANSYLELFLSTTDMQFTKAARTGQNGYTCYLRVDGSMRQYRVDGGVSTQLGTSLGSTTPVLGSFIPIRINVTPTSITFTRTDTGQSRTTSDTTYRGLNYLYAVRGGLTYRWKDVTIS